MSKYLIVIWKWDLKWEYNKRTTSNDFIDFIGKESKFEVKVESGGNEDDELKFIGFTKNNSYDQSIGYTLNHIENECPSIFQDENNQILLLLHGNLPDNFIEENKKQILNKFAGKKLKARLFFGGTGKVYEKLIDESNTYFLKNAINKPMDVDNFSIKRDNFLEVWDWYWNKLELENLKRDIINLWLPLAIDVQGLSEVEEIKRNDYLKEIYADLDKDNYVKSLSDGWEEVKKILLPESESKEVLDKKYQLSEEEKEKVKFPIENIDADSLKNFIKDNYNGTANLHFLPKWLEEVVRVIDEKINSGD